METSPFDVAQDGNLFPREDLLDAVADSDWRDRPVPLATWILTALGITILAAGLPVARLIVMGSVEFAASGPTPFLNPVHALARVIGRSGIGIEATFFLLSALALGLCLPAIGLMLRAAGFGTRLAFVAALVATTSPLLILAGRLPTDAPFAVLAGALVIAAAAGPSDEGPVGERGYALRLVLALAVAHLLHASAGLLVIPTLIALRARTTHARRLGSSGLVGVWIAFFAARRAGLMGVPGEASALFAHWADAAFAGGFAWAVLPFAWRRESEEEPPPLWLVAALILTVSAIFVPRLGAAFGLFAVPVLAMFVANHLARCARPDRALAWALALGLGQVGLALLALPQTPETTASFAATDPGETRPTDIVIVDDDSSIVAYLLRRRLGLTVREPQATTEGGTAGRRTLSLDRPRRARVPILDSKTGKVTARE